PSGDRFLVLTADRITCVRTRTWEELWSAPRSVKLSRFSPPAFSPDGGLVAVCTAAGRIGLFDPATGACHAQLQLHDRTDVQWLNLSPDGTRLAVTQSGWVFVWDLRAIRSGLADLGLDWVAPAFRQPPPVGIPRSLTVDDPTYSPRRWS